MGVDITHVIRHEFRDVKNRAASVEFVMKTIERLKKNLHLYGLDDEFELRLDDPDFGLIFRIPVYDMQFRLHNGFWEIDSFYHYCQIVMHDGDYFWLRRRTFDVARALGQNEAWYACEYYTWNGGNIDGIYVPFEEWIEYTQQTYGPIPEFSQDEIMKQGDVYFPDHEPVYHDSFKECFDTFNEVQRKLPDYELLGISYIGNKYYRCKKSGGLYLIHSESLQPMFSEPIEVLDCPLNGPEIVIKKGGLSAVFDMDGQQLTDFVPGRFDWKWGKDVVNSMRVIYNEEAKIELPPM